MKLKKVLALTLAGIMTVGLAACGGTKESSEKTEAGKEKQKLVIWSWGADEEKKAREALIASIQVGSVLKGTVETLQNYGAFVKLENGLSGLVHVSQISQKRVKLPSDVLEVGQEVEVKVIGIKDGKISLSMKALEEKEEEPVEKVEIPKSEDIGTSLGDLFKNLNL